MKKVSFKETLENRRCVLELELKDKTFIITCSAAAVGAQKQEATIIELFESIIRFDENKEEIMKAINEELDMNQLIDLIVVINEELALKKK